MRFSPSPPSSRPQLAPELALKPVIPDQSTATLNHTKEMSGRSGRKLSPAGPMTSQERWQEPEGVYTRLRTEVIWSVSVPGQKHGGILYLGGGGGGGQLTDTWFWFEQSPGLTCWHQERSVGNVRDGYRSL